jgi:dihydrofolate reductase
MRRVRYAVAMSLDGYIAGPTGETDWILMDPDIDFGAVSTEFDTLLIGRHTFNSMRALGGGEPGGLFEGMKIVVASRTLDQRDYQGVSIVSGNLRQAVTALKEEPGKDIWLSGGGDLFRTLLDLDLVDTIEVVVIPIVLGQGIPLLPSPARQATLTLTSHRVFGKTGTVSLAYDIRSSQSKRTGGPE